MSFSLDIYKKDVKISVQTGLFNALAHRGKNLNAFLFVIIPKIYSTAGCPFVQKGLIISHGNEAF